MKKLMIVMSFLFLVMAKGNAVAASTVQLTIDGVTYSCQPNGGNNPAPPAPPPSLNYCRCREDQYRTNDWDYYLEKYDRTTKAFVLMEAYKKSDSNQGVDDRGACTNARLTDVRCFLE